MSIKLQNEIKEIIKSSLIIKPKDLEKKMNMTQSTCRRYLIKLEKEGFLKREFGEIIYKEKNKYSQDKIAINAINENIEIKKKLAKIGAFLAKDYDIIYIDSSSCNYFLFDYIEKKDTFIYTNSLINAKRAIEKGFTNIYIVSGYIKTNTFTIISNLDGIINKINFPISFMGVNAISSDNDFMTPEINEGEMKNKILKNSQLVVFLVEKEKFNQKSIFSFDNEGTNKIVISDIEKWKETSKFNLIKIKER
ncbi:MAG: DeoR/GlpR family DNA-binding transcription regulator [Metamycoplasmataceae bacterium]